MRLVLAVALASSLLVAALFVPLRPDHGDLADLAARLGFHDPRDLVEVVETVRATGRLPQRYLTKDQAASRGWRAGRDLCEVAPDRVIGGDRFHNREGRLPDAPGRVWFEADLDFACGRRGAKRLVFSDDGLIFVTVDHYESFVELPR